MGASISTPRSDQVPQLKYALELFFNGVPTIAEAVSWEATAIIGILDNPSSLPISSLKYPYISPGFIMGLNICIGKFRFDIMSLSQSPSTAFNNCEVDAIVYSLYTSPVK